MARTIRLQRTLVKAITYRLLVVSLDFLTIYLLTGRIRVAAGFMLVSNIYTSFTYFFHERLWARIKWGIAA